MDLVGSKKDPRKGIPLSIDKKTVHRKDTFFQTHFVILRLHEVTSSEVAPFLEHLCLHPALTELADASPGFGRNQSVFFIWQVLVYWNKGPPKPGLPYQKLEPLDWNRWLVTLHVPFPHPKGPKVQHKQPWHTSTSQGIPRLWVVPNTPPLYFLTELGLCWAPTKNQGTVPPVPLTCFAPRGVRTTRPEPGS